MSRGNRRDKIFLDDVDRHDFIKTLAEACQKTGWQVHAYCLMPNHYHLVVDGDRRTVAARSDPLREGHRCADAPGHLERSKSQPAQPHGARLATRYRPSATSHKRQPRRHQVN
ncbi:MAG TPA: transposase [Dongiaceae bacterium]|nr:transposase [Dongiaceae bacterium]